MSSVYILAPFDAEGKSGLLPLYTGFIAAGVTVSALPYFSTAVHASDEAVTDFLARAQTEEALVVVAGEVQPTWQLYLDPEKTAIIDGFWQGAAYHFTNRQYDELTTAQLAISALAEEVYLFAGVAEEHLLYAEGQFFKSSQPYLETVDRTRAYYLWCAYVLTARYRGMEPKEALKTASMQLAQASQKRFGDNMHPQAFL